MLFVINGKIEQGGSEVSQALEAIESKYNKKELLLISALVSENGTQRQERQERFLTAIF